LNRAHSQALKQRPREDLIKIKRLQPKALLPADQPKRYIIGFDCPSGLAGNIDKMGTQISEDLNKLSLLKRESRCSQGESPVICPPNRSNLEEFTSSFNAVLTRRTREIFGFQDTHGVKANAYRDGFTNTGKEYQTLNDTETSFTAKKERI